jgi:hypothetical protein
VAASPTSSAPAPPPRGEEADPSRFRIGFSVNGGVGSGGGASGAVLGASFQIGWQFDRSIAVYGRASVMRWSSSTKVSADQQVAASGAAGFQLSPLFSLTRATTFEAAAGPSLDGLSTTSSVSNASSSTSTARGDPVTYHSASYFGLHGRVALHLHAEPSPETGRRSGLTIALDIHPTFAEGSTLAFFTIGVGADWF